MRPILVSFCATFLLCASCQTPPSAYTVASTYLSLSKDSVPEFSKSYELDSDTHGQGWVLRRGTKVTFHADGRAELDTIAYATDNLPLPNALHLEIIQYGPDGNILFGLPGTDVGMPIHFRYPRMDYPVHRNFGYNRAHFPRIASVKLTARLLKESTQPQPAPSTSGKQ